MIVVLRLGHRIGRDARISTHCGLVARALGANKIIYSGDTRPYSKLMWAALGADLLIHEATFSSRHYLKAMENGHTTALEAGEIASFADAKKLILVHISPRYEGKEGELLSEAKLSFEGEVMVAEDWLRIKV